jgi:hypothetical protein
MLSVMMQWGSLKLKCGSTALKMAACRADNDQHSGRPSTS